MSLMGTDHGRNSGNRDMLPAFVLSLCEEQGCRTVETLTIEMHYDWKEGAIIR